MWHRRGPWIVPTWQGIAVIALFLLVWVIGLITMIANGAGG